jgi:hypothetical protein
MRRVLMVALIALSILTPGSALAKLPPFTVEPATDTATAGEPIHITVRFWNDAHHTDPASWPAMKRFGELFWFYPSDDLAAAEPVSARLIRPGVYESEVTPTRPGTWLLCTWSVGCDEKSRGGYSSRIELTVLAETGPAAGSQQEPEGLSPQAPLIVFLGLLASIFVGRRFLGARRSMAWRRAPFDRR